MFISSKRQKVKKQNNIITFFIPISMRNRIENKITNKETLTDFIKKAALKTIQDNISSSTYNKKEKKVVLMGFRLSNEVLNLINKYMQLNNIKSYSVFLRIAIDYYLKFN